MNIFFFVSFILSTFIVYAMEKYTCHLVAKIESILLTYRFTQGWRLFLSLFGFLGCWNFITSSTILILSSAVYVYLLIQNIELIFAAPFVISFILLPFFLLHRIIYRFHYYRNKLNYSRWYSWCCGSFHVIMLIFCLFCIFLIPLIFAIIASLKQIEVSTLELIFNYLKSMLLGEQYSIKESSIDGNTILGQLLPVLFTLAASPWLVIRLMYFDRINQNIIDKT